ncbi:helix-turn-helix domain-containing protein [Streptomyces sp. NPDC059175]|uniref:helix-turn-helix domain-containing protein n=1 Tax=Streptomyces sp. NPDC059175 TaxID=3346757 RepID=UPI0036ABF67E
MLDPLTRDELLALPATVDLITGARAFGLGRTTAYDLAKAGEFPAAVIKAGKAYRVITADLLRVLHINPETSDAAAGATATASSEHTTHAA